MVFVGYQGEGTLGRRLLDGVKSVKLFGEEIAVKARIVNFHGLSSHADRDGLLRWIGAFEPKPKEVFVVHGDKDVTEIYAQTLRERGFSAHSANYEEVYDLLTGRIVAPGIAGLSPSGGDGPPPDGGHRPQPGRRQQGSGQICRSAPRPHRQVGSLSIHGNNRKPAPAPSRSGGRSCSFRERHLPEPGSQRPGRRCPEPWPVPRSGGRPDRSNRRSACGRPGWTRG